MSEQDASHRDGQSAGQPDGHGAAQGAGTLAAGEPEQLTYVLESRLAPHLEAASAAVRDAERTVEQARERVADAERAQARSAYTSDPLPFMRQGVQEEVEGLERKTTEKKVRTSYRFLLDRSVDLAAAEVQRFHDDRSAAARQREDGLEARREAERRAEEALGAARSMQERVLAAEQAARQGLAVLVDKLG